MVHWPFDSPNSFSARSGSGLGICASLSKVKAWISGDLLGIQRPKKSFGYEGSRQGAPRTPTVMGLVSPSSLGRKRLVQVQGGFGSGSGGDVM